jgi:excisionase family DNA binding protein
MPEPTEPERFVTIEELSALLGVSTPTLHRWIQKGALPVFQPGGPRTRLLFRVSDLKQRFRPQMVEPPNNDGGTTRSHLPGRRPGWMNSRPPSSTE